jgi:hypothetical protein
MLACGYIVHLKKKLLSVNLSQLTGSEDGEAVEDDIFN